MAKDWVAASVVEIDEIHCLVISMSDALLARIHFAKG